MIHKVKIKLYTVRIQLYLKLYIKYRWYRRFVTLFGPQKTLANRLLLGFLALLVSTYGLFGYYQPNSKAEVGSVSSLGRGVVGYGKSGNTTPQARQWSKGNNAFGAETATVSSLTPVQVVTKINPVKPNEVMTVVQNTDISANCPTTCNIQVLISTDFGSTWSSSLGPILIGENGVSRRFDLAYEQKSGQAVLAYPETTVSTNSHKVLYRTFDGTSWSTESNYEVSTESAHKLTWIELTEKPASDEIALGYLTNRTATNNVGAAIWNGSNFTSTMRKQGTPPGGLCDTTNGAEGSEKCFDIVYETATGRPVMIWGAQLGADTTNTIRASIFDGTNWGANVTINLGTNSDDATMMDCESNPLPMSREIACISWGQGVDDGTGTVGQVQSWTINNGALGVANANIDIAARDRGGAASNDSGGMYVAMTFVADGGDYKFVGVYSDSNSAPTSNKLSMTSFNGSAWTNSANVINLGTTVGIVNSMKFTKNEANLSEALLLINDEANDVNGSLVSLQGTSIVSVGISEITDVSANIFLPAFDFAFDPSRAPSKLTQTGYIWENDDSATADGASQLAPANTAFTARKGESVNLRTQLKNSGGPIDNDNLSLFYDKNDGKWNRVTNGSRSQGSANSGVPWGVMSGNCDNNNYKCTTIESANSVGQDSAIAVGPDNKPWTVYRNETDQSIRAAKFVGTGGTGCGATTEWSCYTVEDTTLASYSDHMSIAVDSNGVPWIAMVDRVSTQLKVAKFVGTGGSGCIGGVGDWQCYSIDGGGDHSSIVIKNGNTPWVSYKNAGKVRIAQFTGTGGTGCSASSAWSCTDAAIFTDPAFTSLTIADNGAVWMSFQVRPTAGTDEDLYAAKYVGSGGTGCGGPTAWTCYAVDTSSSALVGAGNSIVVDSQGNPWVSYMDETTYKLKVAQFIGGTNGNCSNTAWHCSVIDNALCSTGVTNFCNDTSITIDKKGRIQIVYKDNDGAGGSDGLWIATYSSAERGFDSTDRRLGCGVETRWSCSAIEYANDPGFDVSMDIGKDGVIWVLGKNGNDDMRVYNTVNDWIYENVETIGSNASMAIDNDGRPYFVFSGTTQDVYVAEYVGTGGDCSNAAYECTRVFSSAGTAIDNISINIDQHNTPWIVWREQNATNTQMVYARYVGGASGNCTSTAWQCGLIAGGGGAFRGWYGSIEFSPQGVPFVIYGDSSTNSIRIAKYTGFSVATSPSCGSVVSTWECSIIAQDATNSYFDSSLNYRAGLGFGIDGSIWVAFSQTTSDDVIIAQYVGTGGTGCGSAGTGAWSCTAVATTNEINKGISLVMSSDGVTPLVTYQDKTASSLNIAQYVGTGGVGCASSAWTCTKIADHASDTVAEFVDIALDSSGTPWITYTNNTSVYIAQFVGGSSQSSCGTGSSAWRCTPLETVVNASGSNVKIAFSTDGGVYVTYYNTTDSRLKYAYLPANNEITSTSSMVANGSSISETHADMTTVSDTTNRDDSDCIGGGTFITGKKFASASVSDYAMNGAFMTTDYCTELGFSLDTSQAQPGATYRFIIASDDAFDSGSNLWRSPIAVTNYATLSISPVEDSRTFYSKDATQDWTDCEGTTDSWMCTTLFDSASDIAGNGPIKMAIDPDGNPWIAFGVDTDVGEPYPDDLYVAKYVGTGGTGCTGATISTAWKCTKIEGTNLYVAQTSIDIAIGDDGKVWLTYQDKTNTSLKMANYVGTGGTGCTDTTEWTCYLIDDVTAANAANGANIALDPASNSPWIVYGGDDANVDKRIAHYVGSGGAGCDNSAWQCETVYTPGNFSGYYENRITIGPNGYPWMAFSGNATNEPYFANYAGCNFNANPCTTTRWESLSVTSENFAGAIDIATNANNKPIIAAKNTGGTDSWLAFMEYAGVNEAANVGEDCTGDLRAWQCTRITKSTGNTYMANAVDMTTDVNGAPIIAYQYGNDSASNVAKIYSARYVGTGGTGCTETNAWTCGLIYDASVVGGASVGICDGKGLSIAATSNGTTFAAFHKGDSLACNSSTASAGDIIIAMRKPLSTPLQSESQLKSGAVGAKKSSGRYSLTPGRSGLSYEKCAGNTDQLGYCGLFAKDGLFDSMSVNAYESPVYNMTWQYKDINEGFGVYWAGRTGLAPSTAGSSGDITLQVYRYGATNAWETIATDSSSSNCNTSTCTLKGAVSTNLQEYIKGNARDGFWVQARVVQKSGTTGFTFKTDTLRIEKTADYLRGGASFREGQERSLEW